MTDDDQRVDPRYDPAFQRGFEGEVTSGLRYPHLGAALGARRARSLPQQRAEPEVEDYGVQEAAQTRTGADAEPEPAPEYVPVRSLGMRDLGRNPFLITLVVLGVGLTIGGIAWANQARQIVADLATPSSTTGTCRRRSSAPR